jgi:hypothetical protein
MKSLMVQQNTQPDHLPANNIQMLAQQIDPLLFKGIGTAPCPHHISNPTTLVACADMQNGFI